MQIIIAGCGLGGMAAGLALLNHPDIAKSPSGPRHTIRIFEANDRPKNAGAFIFIRPPGYKNLSLISPDYIAPFLRNARKQETWNLVDKGLHSTFDLGNEYMFTVLYQELWDVMREACINAGIVIEFSKPIASVVESAEEAVVTFADGTTSSAELVIGSDGSKSKVRKCMFESMGMSDFPVHYTGLFDIMVAMPADEVAPSFHSLDGLSGPLFLRGSKGSIFAHYNDAERKNIGLILQMKVSDEIVASWKAKRVEDKKAAVELFRSTLSEIEGPFSELFDWTIAHPDQKVSLHQLRSLEPLTTWHSSRIVLIGDAAHAIPPFTGFGLTSTVLDSAEMSPLLASLPEKPTAEDLRNVFSVWEKGRRPAMLKIIEATLKEGVDRHKEGFFFQWFRAIMTWAVGKGFWLWATVDSWFRPKGSVVRNVFEI